MPSSRRVSKEKPLPPEVVQPLESVSSTSSVVSTTITTTVTTAKKPQRRKRGKDDSEEAPKAKQRRAPATKTTNKPESDTPAIPKPLPVRKTNKPPGNTEIMKIQSAPPSYQKPVIPSIPSTIKLVKSTFYEPPPFDSLIDKPSTSDNFELVLPEDEVLASQLKSEFEIWSVEDDFLLIASYSHVEDTRIIFLECDFSHAFLRYEIEQRLDAYFYDEIRGDLMRQRLDKLDGNTRRILSSKVPFNGPEIALLLAIPSTFNPDIHFFTDMLSVERQVFGYRRTFRDLLKKWQVYKNHGMLCDQMNDTTEVIVEDKADPAFCKRMGKRVLDFSADEFDQPLAKGFIHEDEFQHIASLRSGSLLYTIEMPSTIIGCGDYSFQPDVDLRELGETSKITAKQAVLEYDETRQFSIKNLGVHAIIINDSIVVTQGNEVLLPSECVIKFDKISLQFRISNAVPKKITIDWNRLPKESSHLEPTNNRLKLISEIEDGFSRIPPNHKNPDSLKHSLKAKFLNFQNNSVPRC